MRGAAGARCLGSRRGRELGWGLAAAEPGIMDTYVEPLVLAAAAGTGTSTHRAGEGETDRGRHADCVVLTSKSAENQIVYRRAHHHPPTPPRHPPTTNRMGSREPPPLQPGARRGPFARYGPGRHPCHPHTQGTGAGRDVAGAVGSRARRSSQPGSHRWPRRIREKWRKPRRRRARAHVRTQQSSCCWCDA